ncbi:WGR domain-containing protein [Rhizobium rhizoryzae]|uniref:WGR domain-containing protein n=1 Tax=Rhizobium rhizoryzae TaxID=451876 RepID=UPI00161CD13C|nr:WGR domain-containing protein [Rhizobium rhizoryzae]
MSDQHFELHLCRFDERRNMAGFYSLALQPSLFNEISVVRTWGRIGTRGRSRVDLFLNEHSAITHFLALAKWKRGRGYRPMHPARQPLPLG